VTDAQPQSDDRRDHVLKAGFAVRRAVLGDAHVDRAQSQTDDLTRDFQQLITRYAWGEVWSREGLDRRTRSCLTLALLTALHCTDELPMHVRAALTNGVTRDEIAEVLLHTAVYAGMPAANSAFAIARRTLDELDVPAGESTAERDAGADG
jgi:4-carboxymuconolactone decarboxylase